MSEMCMFLRTVSNIEHHDGVLSVGFAEKSFTKEECEKIIAMSNKFESKQGGLGEQEDINNTKHNSEICALAPTMETRWIYEKINAFVVAANNSFKYDLYGLEEFKIATYGPDNYYDWHMDLGKDVTSTRKLSLTLQLSESDDYEGGDLEFRGGGVPPVAPREIGTIIIFPSFLSHQIAPVTKGVRKSMVVRVHGPSFK